LPWPMLRSRAAWPPSVVFRRRRPTMRSPAAGRASRTTAPGNEGEVLQPLLGRGEAVREGGDASLAVTSMPRSCPARRKGAITPAPSDMALKRGEHPSARRAGSPPPARWGGWARRPPAAPARRGAASPGSQARPGMARCAILRDAPCWTTMLRPFAR
jgi:hypothetical protein